MKTERALTLIMFAAFCQNKGAIEILKKYKRVLDIFEAASIWDIKIVSNITIENPELINSFSPDGFTSLGLASFFGNLEIVKLLFG